MLAARRELRSAVTRSGIVEESWRTPAEEQQGSPGSGLEQRFLPTKLTKMKKLGPRRKGKSSHPGEISIFF
jgi:hypothetical protein